MVFPCIFTLPAPRHAKKGQRESLCQRIPASMASTVAAGAALPLYEVGRDRPGEERGDDVSFLLWGGCEELQFAMQDLGMQDLVMQDDPGVGDVVGGPGGCEREASDSWAAVLDDKFELARFETLQTAWASAEGEQPSAGASPCLSPCLSLCLSPCLSPWTSPPCSPGPPRKRVREASPPRLVKRGPAAKDASPPPLCIALRAEPRAAAGARRVQMTLCGRVQQAVVRFVF